MNAARIRNTYAEIHLGRLRDNIRKLREALGRDKFFCPMVKANAYGHGDIEVAKVSELENVDAVGVVLVEEGIHLRKSNIQTSILVFGLFDSAGAEEVVRYNLTPVLSSWEQLERLEHVLEGPALYPVHLKFNTGMNRLGFDPEETSRLMTHFRSHSILELKGICTHLASSDDGGISGGLSQVQMTKWKSIKQQFADFHVVAHVYNSGAILRGVNRYSSFENDGARPGIAIYGASPFSSRELDFTAATLEPVMSLKSELVLVRKLSEGETVSYGATWKAHRPTWLGVVPIGYADGLPRQLSNRGAFLYRGGLVPIVGRICMDHTMIDLTDRVGAWDPEIGEEIVVFGKQGITLYTVDELALMCGTIPYEILSNISMRVPRVYTGLT